MPGVAVCWMFFVLQFQLNPGYAGTYRKVLAISILEIHGCKDPKLKVLRQSAGSFNI
jgi:hypothetical protein